jgi:small subunit ribosomal protein S7
MPRKKTKSFKRVLEPDQKYQNVMVSKMINKIMRGGKKRLAETLIHDALASAEAKGKHLAMTWILGAARGKSGKAFAQLLADEFLNAFNNQGDAVKKREDTHRMAEANKAFAHFARY